MSLGSCDGARLFALFWPLRIAQSHTRSTSVFVDEFDAGQLERPSPSAKLRGFAASKIEGK